MTLPNKPFEYRSKDLNQSYCFTEEELSQLITVVKDKFPKRETKIILNVGLKSGLTYSPKSLEELVTKETNSGENFITSLKIDISFGSPYSAGYKDVSIDIDNRKALSQLWYRVVGEERDWVTSTSSLVKEHLNTMNTHYGFLYNFSLMFVFAIIFGATLGSVTKSYMTTNMTTDFIISLVTFPLIMLVGKLIGDWLFPKFVIAIGQEKKKQESRDFIKKSLFWGVLVATAISLVFYMLPSRA